MTKHRVIPLICFVAGTICVTSGVLLLKREPFTQPSSLQQRVGSHAVRVSEIEAGKTNIDTADKPVPVSPARTPLILIVNIEKAPDDTRAAVAVRNAVSRWVNTPCTILHYRQCSSRTLTKLTPRIILLGGQKTPWWEYNTAELQGVQDLLRRAQVPILGICGGHQLLALAFGGRVAPIRRLKKTTQGGYAGCFREKGWLEIQLTRDDPIFAGLPPRADVWLNHCEEVKALPPHFVALARNSTCPVQAMKQDDAPVYGVQFHPELTSEKNATAGLVVRNLLRVAGLLSKT